MLVPLETLAGWPEATNPTVLQSLGLLIGIPAVAFAIIALLCKASALARTGRGRSTPVTDPVWLGSAPKDQELTEGATASGSGGSHTETGGASARW